MHLIQFEFDMCSHRMTEIFYLINTHTAKLSFVSSESNAIPKLEHCSHLNLNFRFYKLHSFRHNLIHRIRYAYELREPHIPSQCNDEGTTQFADLVFQMPNAIGTMMMAHGKILLKINYRVQAVNSRPFLFIINHNFRL